jgi:hypothetical protein
VLASSAYGNAEPRFALFFDAPEIVAFSFPLIDA